MYDMQQAKVDSLAGKIYGFNFDCKTGKLDWRNQRVVFDFKNHPELKGFPDGLAICDRGHLWVATFEGKKVSYFDILILKLKINNASNQLKF